MVLRSNDFKTQCCIMFRHSFKNKNTLSKYQKTTKLTVKIQFLIAITKLNGRMKRSVPKSTSSVSELLISSWAYLGLTYRTNFLKRIPTPATIPNFSCWSQIRTKIIFVNNLHTIFLGYTYLKQLVNIMSSIHFR